MNTKEEIIKKIYDLKGMMKEFQMPKEFISDCDEMIDNVEEYFEEIAGW